MRCGFGDYSAASEAVARGRITKTATAHAWAKQRLHRRHDLLAFVSLSERVQYPAVVCVVVADFNGARTTATIHPVVVAEGRMDHAEKPDPTRGAGDDSRIKPVVVG